MTDEKLSIKKRFEGRYNRWEAELLMTDEKLSIKNGSKGVITSGKLSKAHQGAWIYGKVINNITRSLTSCLDVGEGHKQHHKKPFKAHRFA